MRRSSPPASSLDLLLDTLSNTFGGIMLIALLVALTAASSPSTQPAPIKTEVTQPSVEEPPSTITQADVDQLVSEIAKFPSCDSAQQSVQELETKIGDYKQAGLQPRPTQVTLDNLLAVRRQALRVYKQKQQRVAHRQVQIERATHSMGYWPSSRADELSLPAIYILVTNGTLYCSDLEEVGRFSPRSGGISFTFGNDYGPYTWTLKPLLSPGYTFSDPEKLATYLSQVYQSQAFVQLHINADSSSALLAQEARNHIVHILPDIYLATLHLQDHGFTTIAMQATIKP